MRVIAGTARSLNLKTPAGLDTRPTTDRIKETLFNMLMPYLSGAVFVDLFSGSGGIGIEAISRGARKAYFVENNQKTIACITENIVHTHFEDKSVVLKQDVKGLGKKGELVNTSDGYARNFLFPKNLAVEANAQNMTELKNREQAAKYKIETDTIWADGPRGPDHVEIHGVPAGRGQGEAS